MVAITLPDPRNQLPPLMKGNDPLFTSFWVVTSPYPARTKQIKFAKFNPSDMRSEDLDTLTGVGFMKTTPIYWQRM